MTVTIAASGYGGIGQVVETLPQGFSYVEGSVSPSGDVRVSVEDQEVKFSLAGATSFSYKVTAGTEEGYQTFSGVLKGLSIPEESAPPVVGGAFRVMVEADAEPEPTEVATPDSGTMASADRSFSASSVAPDGELTVTIAANGYGGIGQVVETLPQGFSYVEGSAPSGDVPG